MHDLADPIDAALGVLGLAIPNAPSQPLDRFDDRRFRLHPPGIVGQQAARGLRRVLESHREVEQSKMSGVGIPAFTRMVRRPGNVPGLLRASTGSKCGSTPVATR